MGRTPINQFLRESTSPVRYRSPVLSRPRRGQCCQNRRGRTVPGRDSADRRSTVNSNSLSARADSVEVGYGDGTSFKLRLPEGPAASQLGPDVHALLAILNKELGLSRRTTPVELLSDLRAPSAQKPRKNDRSRRPTRNVVRARWQPAAKLLTDSWVFPDIAARRSPVNDARVATVLPGRLGHSELKCVNYHEWRNCDGEFPP